VALIAEQMLVLRLTLGGEAALASKNLRRVRRLFRTIEKRAVREATP
jgi:hypothetical protein